MKAHTALKLVLDELERAATNHEPLHSPHEGYAVLREEVDELWEEVRGNQGRTHRATSEAVQVAAMGLRYLIDLCPDENAVQHETKVQEYVQRPYTGGGSYSG